MECPNTMWTGDEMFLCRRRCSDPCMHASRKSPIQVLYQTSSHQNHLTSSVLFLREIKIWRSSHVKQCSLTNKLIFKWCAVEGRFDVDISQATATDRLTCRRRGRVDKIISCTVQASHMDVVYKLNSCSFKYEWYQSASNWSQLTWQWKANYHYHISCLSISKYF